MKASFVTITQTCDPESTVKVQADLNAKRLDAYILNSDGVIVRQGIFDTVDKWRIDEICRALSGFDADAMQPLLDAAIWKYQREIGWRDSMTEQAENAFAVDTDDESDARPIHGDYGPRGFYGDGY